VAPQWSPDGHYLAMLSTRGPGGDGIGIWIWERSSATLRRISDRCVAIINPYRPPFEWLDGNRLIVAALPIAPGMTDSQMFDVSRARDHLNSGKATTASVIDSGLARDAVARHQFDLLLVNADKNFGPPFWQTSMDSLAWR